MLVSVAAVGAELSPGPAATQAPSAVVDGRLILGSVAAAGGVRAYTLFVPARMPAAGARSLIVFLHGCTQDAADAIRGVGLNAIAERDGFLVLYPEQRADAHPQRCWNWYADAQTQRGAGEVAVLNAMVREVARANAVDERRIALAGISAGGAMASALAVAYPETFTRLAIHSGLPAGAAHDVASALVAMRHGAEDPDALGAAAFRTMATRARAIPALAWHGAADPVVSARNLTATARQWAVTNALALGAPPPGAEPTERETVHTPGRYDAERLVWRTVDGTVLAESWNVSGLGHAWSGGSSDGTFTDPKGPPATEIMVRFLLAGNPQGR